MAVSRIKEWSQGEVLTADELNAEIDNLNQSAVAWPMTANGSAAGYEIQNAKLATLKQLNDNVVTMDNYASFAAAITAIGSTVTTLLINANVNVTANATVPSTCTLWFLGQGKLTVSVAVTCTINGPIIAAPRQIFAGSGTVAGFANVPEVYPDWWAVNTTPGTTDMLPAAQAAVDARGIKGGKVRFLGTDYLLNGVLTTTYANIILEGAGRSSTRLLGGHTTGPVVRFRRAYSGIRNMSIYGDATRQAAAAGTNYGVQFEADDVADNANDRTQECFVEDCRIFSQPSHGIVIVGPVTNGTAINRCWVQSNGGHGIVIDRGPLTSRSNLLGSGPASISIRDCEIHSNDGHAVCAGSPTESVATPALRIVMENVDTAGNAQDAGVRHGLYEVWLRGTNMDVRTTGLDGGGVRGGIFAAGRNFWFRNNRFINCTSSVQVGNYSDLPTQGVNIEGMSVITLAQDPAVIIDSGASNVRILNWLNSNITSLVTPNMPGTQIDYVPQIVQKTADEVVNNSDVLQDDNELKFYMAADENIAFQCVIQHISANTTPDLKVAFTVPAGASLRWGPSNSIKIDESDAIVEQNEVLVSGTAANFGSTTSRRQIVIEGSVDNGSTAGYLQLQWAQVTATAVNTTVYAIASHLKVWRKY